MDTENKLDTIFTSDMRFLMILSYIVLGNTAVINRFIEHAHRLPVHAWSTLYCIDQFPGIRAKEITQLFPRPQNTISRAVSQLVERGLVRHKPSQTDGREKRLFTTDKGAALLAELRVAIVERQDEMFAPLEDDERDVFFRLALKIAKGSNLLETVAMRVPETP